MEKPVVKRKNLLLWSVVGGLYFAGVIAFIVFALGHPEWLSETYIRVFISFIFFLFAVCYWLFASKISTYAIGSIQIIAALGSNYYQLYRIATTPKHMEVYDRFVFLLAGIALIVSGLKTIDRADDETGKTKGLATSLSNGSSAAPNPD
jgi:hypothetical protein